MLYKIIVLGLIHMCEGSVVLDSLSQRGIHIADYCPKMKYCPEGAHVMCMYYDPKHVMGPRCSNPKNASITHELANKLLEVSNAVRSKIALGKEKGKGGNYLPKGYGIYRLKWDSELATFAQVLANQCVLRHDLCRATKKFPDPGQTAGLVRFSYPDWYPVSKSAHFTTPGLNNPKLFYAITQTLKSWYGQKNSVTSDMINNYPDWTLNPNRQDGRLYLEMIYGPATHMGCGISAYTEYAYYDNNAALNYNSVQIICNYSSRPRKSGSVYNTVAPTAPGFSKCGCPEGSVEDEDCLCHESGDMPTPTPLKQVVPRKCVKGDASCDPTVVVLPIFTVEDAPPQKLITYGGANETVDNTSLEIFDFYKSEPKINLYKERINTIMSNNRLNIGQFASTTRSVFKKQIFDVKNRYFKKRIPDYPKSLAATHKTILKRPLQRKESVFTRVPKFELPLMKRKVNPIKKDVKPRKDFELGQKLVKKYLTNKITNDSSKKINIPEPIKSILPDIHGQDGVTETVLHTAEDKVIDFNQFLKDNNISAMTTTTTLPLNNTDHVMMVLDNLENLVKIVELHGADKDIFDAKIRKIYEKVVGKPIIPSVENKIKQEIHKSLSEVGTPKTSTYEAETSVSDKYLHTDLNNKPLSKNHNSLVKDEDFLKEYNDNEKEYSHPKFILSAESPLYLDEIKSRNVYQNDKEKSIYRNDNNDHIKYKNNKGRMTKKYVDFDAYDDPLSPERRKYYQDRLDRLERKLRKHHNDLERQRGVRPMRPTEELRTRPKNQMEDTFYPERARFINRFR